MVHGAKVQCTNFISNNKVMEKIEQSDISKNSWSVLYDNFFWYALVSRAGRGCKAMYHVIPWECKNRIRLLHKWIASDVNMEDPLFVPQHIIIKGVTKEAWPFKADISSVMMKSAKLSNWRCKVAMEENKLKQTEKKIGRKKNYERNKWSNTAKKKDTSVIEPYN